jgi:DNA-binding NtrC family response regulator
MKQRILIADDDDSARSGLAALLSTWGYEVREAIDGKDALVQAPDFEPAIVIADLVMPGLDGLGLLKPLAEADPNVVVILLTGHATVETAVSAMRDGAYDYLTKPVDPRRLRAILEKAFDRAEVLREVTLLRRQLKQSRGFGDLLGASAPMQEVYRLLELASSSSAPVLITGETGTGKELVARTIHQMSPRGKGPFVAVNCSAIPETLLESQLFGHRRGAFTDAREDRRGLLLEARGGTVLLDEIGDMPASLQAKILRALQEKEVHPLGAPAPVPIDVRIVAATHRDLEALVAEGRFRHDLFYRLNVITIRVPPLRERMEDLVPLIAHFLEKHGRRLGRSGCTLSHEAMSALRHHSWPGNVRELENSIERALVLGRDDVLWPEDLPEAFRTHAPLRAGPAGAPLPPLSEVERDHILRTLREVRGNKTAAARLLGLDRKTLYRKLDTYGLRPPAPRDRA